MEPRLTEEERNAVEFLRDENDDLLTKQFNTEHNVLRWAQGYGFNLEEASPQLRKHLKFRNFYDLDNAEKIKEHEILRKYFPIGLVGETGLDNNLLVIECAGRIDLMGILKSVHLSDFLIQRSRFQEKMMKAMNELEARNGKQSAVVYILDLDGLKFDSALLNIVTGPYRILWASVYSNYPEWIDKMLIVNAPCFMSIIWKAIGPLLPERTRNKVRICGSGGDWKSTIQQFAKPENIPKHWGGTLVDANGDEMCRDRLNIPFEPIPESLYWEPSKETPAPEDLVCTTIPAGKARTYTFVVQHNEPIYMVVNRFCDRTFGMGVWYHPEGSAIDYPLSQMQDWMPDFDYPGMPTTDYMRIRAPGSGVYKVKFGNESAWIRSLTVFHRIRFQTEDKLDVSVSCYNNN